MKTIKHILISSIFLCSCNSLIAGQPKQPTLVYKNTFDDKKALNDWVMEGPGLANIDKGRLLIRSKWAPEIGKLKDEIPLIEPGGDKYYPYLKKWVQEREPENMPKYLLKKMGPSKFVGGHIQYWNKQVHPENFIIRLKFQAANPYPLHMVTFCGRGLKEESVFDPKLAPRYGVAAQYMFGDIRNYRVSYWAGSRGTANMRRAPGRVLASTKKADVTRDALKKPVQLEIIRWKGRIVFKCDDQILVDWTDKEPFPDGYFSLRLMAAAAGYYDDYEVYKLHADPFN